MYYSLQLNPTLNSTGFIIMSRIISPENLYSRISKFLFLFNYIHEFLHFYLFFIFPGVYRNSKSSCINLQNLEKRDMGSPTSQKENNTDKKVPKLWRWLWCNCFTESVIPFFIITKKYHSFASKLKSWIDNSRNSSDRGLQSLSLPWWVNNILMK
jgi:hypothetical protein